MAWTTEDKFLLKLLFKPEEVQSALPDGDAGSIPAGYAPDWPRLVETAQREGVAALIFHTLSRHHLEYLVPQESLRNLSNPYHINLKRNMAIIGKLRNVLAILQEKGISCIVLKGIVLAERIYPSMAVRGMSDVDILIRKNDLFKADEILSSLGYISCDSSVAKAAHNPVGYLASLEYRCNTSPLSLHVHWHIVNTSVPATAFIEQIDMNRLWDQAMSASVADRQALMLRPEHLVIYLCEHALRVGHSFDRLILICDIFFSIKAFEQTIDWGFMEEESRRFNLSRFVYHGLSIVQHYTSLDKPGDLAAKLKPNDISLGERFFLHLQRNNRRIRGSSYFIHLAMNQGIRAKCRFIIRTFFPPRQILMQRKRGSPSESAGSYYLFRIREIYSHILKLFLRSD